MPDGSLLREVLAERVLGGWISRQGGALEEIRRRHKHVWATLKKLRDIWKGAKIRKRTKTKRGDSLAFGAFGFNLATSALNKAVEDRVHSFQNRVVRHVVGAPPVWTVNEAARISSSWIKTRYSIKPWNNRLRKLRIKLANKFLSRGPGTPNFDFIVNSQGNPWGLPGKCLNVPRKRLSWVDMVRREAVGAS